MKKFLIAAAAAATLATGASAAQAKVHFNLYLDAPIYGHGFYHDAGYYDTQCFKKKIMIVIGHDYYGDPIFGWKTKKVCKKVWIGY